jgi:hypothetical protein
MNEDLFALWAPPESPWSVWAKPVLFADAPPLPKTDEPLNIPVAENFPRPSSTAAIVDLDGARSLIVGLALAKIGYRPVPLYNSGIEAAMLVNMFPIGELLSYGAGTLSRCTIGDNAPPAFLLNADRLDHGEDAKHPGRYDNRWCVVPQDMPSAEFLKDSGIRQVALLSKEVKDDLAHILRRYQDAGLSILCAPDLGTAPVSITVEKPEFYKSLLYRLQAYTGLRRNAAGGFGAIVPEPSSGGGFG